MPVKSPIDGETGSGEIQHSLVAARLPPRDLRELREIIVSRQVKLTPNLEKLVRFALDYPGDVAFCTIRDLAQHCKVSTTTVLRLPSAFGFTKFEDFRELFRSEIRRMRAGQADEA